MNNIQNLVHTPESTFPQLQVLEAAITLFQGTALTALVRVPDSIKTHILFRFSKIYVIECTSANLVDMISK